jgi:hypothetical protein
MTTIFCLLFPRIFSSSVLPFSIDRLAFLPYRSSFTRYIVHDHVWLVLLASVFLRVLLTIDTYDDISNTFSFTTINFLRHVTTYDKRRHLRSFNLHAHIPIRRHFDNIFSKYDNYFQITTTFSIFPLKQRHKSIFIILNIII